MRHKLLGTFTTKDQLQNTLELIHKKHTLALPKIFVLELQDSAELLVTYNVIDSVHFLINHSLVLNRNKSTNTLFTINGLNSLVKDLTGSQDHTYKLDFTKYQSSIILTSGFKSRVTRTKIVSICT